MSPPPLRRSHPALEMIPTATIPEEGFGRLEYRLERIEDSYRELTAVVERGVGVQHDTLVVLARIDSRQEREMGDRKDEEKERRDREDRKVAAKESLLANIWGTAKGPITTVLLAASAYAAMRLTGTPSTPTPIQVAPITMAPAPAPAALPPQEEVP